MKLFLHTWRYNIETTIAYHGAAFDYDRNNAIVTIIRPCITDPVSGKPDVGVVECVTVVSGDTFLVVDCDTECVEEHPALDRTEDA